METQPVSQMDRPVKKRRRSKTVRSVVYRRPVMGQNKLMTKRFVYNEVLTGSSLTPDNYGFADFRLSDVPNYTEFTNLFDEYKLTGVRYRWVAYRNSQNTTTSAGVGIYPRVTWAYDSSAASAPTSVSELQEYHTFKEAYLTDAQPVSKWFYFKPKVVQTIFGGYSQASNNPWLLMADPSIQHYGIPFAYTDNYAGQQLRLEAYYYFVFRSVK